MNEHNRAAKGWSNVTKNEWRHARRALIASVRAWANSGCSATEAEKVLEALRVLDAAAAAAMQSANVPTSKRLTAQEVEVIRRRS
jgi:hypothetical protein